MRSDTLRATTYWIDDLDADERLATQTSRLTRTLPPNQRPTPRSPSIRTPMPTLRWSQLGRQFDPAERLWASTNPRSDEDRTGSSEPSAGEPNKDSCRTSSDGAAHADMGAPASGTRASPPCSAPGCRILPRMCCRIAFDGVGHRRERRMMGREEVQGRGRFFCSLIST